MEILYLLIPLSLALSVVIVWALIWAVNNGQFDDLEGPAHRILDDSDEQAGGEGEDARRPGDVQGRE